MTLALTPITLREANAFVEAHHRHHKPARGCILCVAVSDVDTVRGVAIRQTERYAHLCPGGIHDAARATSGALPETKGAEVVPMRRGDG